MLKFLTLALLLKRSLINASKTEDCEFVINFPKWDCATFQYYFSETNIPHTLYCLDYNKLSFPSSPNVTKIFVNRELLQLVEINENNGIIQLEEKYNIKLFDHRLKFDSCNQIHGEDKFDITGRKLVENLFWSPDFDTSYDTWFKPKVDTAQIYLNVKDERDVTNFKLKNEDYRVVIKCETNYQWFPFDTQRCPHPYIIDAFSKDVQVVYDPDKILEQSFIHRSFNPDWYIFLEIGKVINEDKQILPLDLIFQRKISVHILHLYVPSIMLCIASMASLFIPQDYVPGRMGLSVTSCLSMITLFLAAK